MRYIDRVETGWAFRIQLPIGTLVPFHCTASGKTYIASMPPRERRKFVSALTLDRHTNRTHTDPQALLDEVAEIARQGYAIDDEEMMDGMGRAVRSGAETVTAAMSRRWRFMAPRSGCPGPRR